MKSLLFLILIPNILLANEINFTLSSEKYTQKISCYQEEERLFNFINNNTSYLVELPSLATSPIINSALTCRMFLNSLGRKLTSTKKKILISLTKEEDNYRFKNSAFEDECITLGFCKRDFLDHNKISNKLKTCWPKLDANEVLEKWKPKFKNTEYRIVKNVNIKLFPEYNFANEVKNHIKESRNTYLSTMSLGSGITKDLYNSIPIDKNIHLLLDANVLFASSQEYLLTKYFSNKSLYAIPTTSGRLFDTVYHLKFVVSDSKKSAITSMNLSTPEKTKFIDAIYEFDNQEIKEELIQIFNSYKSKQCNSPSDYRCLVDFLNKDRSETKKLHSVLDRSCELYKESNNSLNVTNPYLIKTQTSDIEKIVSNLIKNAKDEIIILSHKFKLDNVHKLIENKREEGLKTKIYTTVKPPFYTSKDKKNIHYTSSKKIKNKIFDPHLKVMLIDRKLLFFGTGNFTYNAFNSASEIFAITDDIKAIKTIEKISNDLNKVFEK